MKKFLFVGVRCMMIVVLLSTMGQALLTVSAETGDPALLALLEEMAAGVDLDEQEQVEEHEAAPDIVVSGDEDSVEIVTNTSYTKELGDYADTCTIKTHKPSGDKYYQNLGLDIPNDLTNIKKYRIQRGNGNRSPWFTLGEGDIDRKDNCGDTYFVGGASRKATRPDSCSRRVWSYFTDHNYETLVCSNEEEVSALLALLEQLNKEQSEEMDVQDELLSLLEGQSAGDLLSLLEDVEANNVALQELLSAVQQTDDEALRELLDIISETETSDDDELKALLENTETNKDDAAQLEGLLAKIEQDKKKNDLLQLLEQQADNDELKDLLTDEQLEPRSFSHAIHQHIMAQNTKQVNAQQLEATATTSNPGIDAPSSFTPLQSLYEKIRAQNTKRVTLQQLEATADGRERKPGQVTLTQLEATAEETSSTQQGKTGSKKSALMGSLFQYTKAKKSDIRTSLAQYLSMKK